MMERIATSVPPSLKIRKKFALEVLEKFLIGSESSFLDTINIILMLKSLPT